MLVETEPRSGEAARGGGQPAVISVLSARHLQVMDANVRPLPSCLPLNFYTAPPSPQNTSSQRGNFHLSLSALPHQKSPLAWAIEKKCAENLQLPQEAQESLESPGKGPRRVCSAGKKRQETLNVQVPKMISQSDGPTFLGT